jgi:hypothetical protein
MVPVSLVKNFETLFISATGELLATSSHIVMVAARRLVFNMLLNARKAEM